MNFLENEEFIRALLELGLTNDQELELIREGFFAPQSSLGRRQKALKDHYRVWFHAQRVQELGNKTAQEGCDRCERGCKYWENDRCIDCGAEHDPGKSSRGDNSYAGFCVGALDAV